jgi:hypothetical protein
MASSAFVGCTRFLVIAGNIDEDLRHCQRRLSSIEKSLESWRSSTVDCLVIGDCRLVIYRVMRIATKSLIRNQYSTTNQQSKIAKLQIDDD